MTHQNQAFVLHARRTQKRKRFSDLVMFLLALAVNSGEILLQPFCYYPQISIMKVFAFLELSLTSFLTCGVSELHIVCRAHCCSPSTFSSLFIVMASRAKCLREEAHSFPRRPSALEEQSMAEATPLFYSTPRPSEGRPARGARRGAPFPPGEGERTTTGTSPARRGTWLSPAPSPQRATRYTTFTRSTL